MSPDPGRPAKAMQKSPNIRKRNVQSLKRLLKRRQLLKIWAKLLVSRVANRLANLVLARLILMPPMPKQPQQQL